MKTQLVSSSSTFEVLTLEEMKDHLRIGYGETAEDELLKGLRKAAQEHVENYTNRKLSPAKWKVYFDQWPSGDSFEIPYPPLRSIPSTGLKYTMSSGGSTTFSSTAWASDTVSTPGRLVLDYNDEWPTESLHNRNPIEITVLCGYSSAGKIPQPVKQAMLLLAGNWYENRENSIVGPSVAELPFGVKALLAPYRIFSF